MVFKGTCNILTDELEIIMHCRLLYRFNLDLKSNSTYSFSLMIVLKLE